MAVEIRAVRAAVNTATGNQDFDVGSWGTTPQAALYIITKAVADNSPVDHGVMGLGLAVSSSERHTGGVRNEHGVATSDTSRRTISDECIVILDETDGSVDGEADFVQFNSGGSKINWGDAPASAYLLTALYFAGFDNVDLQKVDMSASSPQTVTVGFEADIVILMSTNGGNTDTVHNSSELGMGIATWDGATVRQGHLVGYSSDNKASAQNFRGMRNDNIWGGSTTTDWSYRMSISGFDSTGFDLTRVAGTADTSDDWFILSLKLPTGISAWCGGIASPTSTGDDAQTGPGFTPQALIGLISDCPSMNTWEGGATGDADAGGWAISVATESEQYCNCIADENAAADMDTQSLTDDTLIHLTSGDGSDQLIASLSTFDANGWTPNYSTVDTGQARQQFWLAIEEEAGGTAYYQAAAGVLTPVGAIVKSSGKILTGALTAVGSLVKQTAKSFTGSITASGILSTTKVFLLAIGGVITATGTLIKQTTKTFVGSVTAAGTLIKQTLKAFTGAITAVGSLATQKLVGGYYQVVGGVLTMSGIVVRQTGKQAAGIVTMAGSITRSTGKNISGILTPVGSIIKQVGKVVLGSITAAGTLTTQMVYVLVVNGVLTIVGTLTRQTNKQTAGIMTMAGSITKRISKSIIGTLTAIGTLARQLLGLPVPANRIYVIESETRVYAIETENRIYSVPAPPRRKFAIASEDRICSIASENRIYSIPRGVTT